MMLQVPDTGCSGLMLFRTREQMFRAPQSTCNTCCPPERKRTFIAVSHVDEILRQNDSTMEKGGNHFFPSLLSLREFQGWSRLRHPLRRREWLVARLLAKYMVLSEIAIPLSTTGSMIQRQPVVRFVDRGDLLVSDPSSFRRAELLSPARGEVPRLFWFEEDMSHLVSCSVSHSGGWVTVAFTVGDCLLGVDIEKVKVYNEAFRTGCFSDREQAWIELNSAASSVSCEELCTLLWTFKESAFKAGGVGKGFLLRTDVNVGTVLERPLPLLGQPGEMPEMACFELEVFIDGWHRAQGASCLIAADCILSVVTIKKGGNKYCENH